MKKLLALAIVALSVSVAQAVTYTWDNTSGTCLAGTSGIGVGTYPAATGMSFVLSPDLISNAVISSNAPTSGSIALTSITLVQRGSGTNSTYAYITVSSSDGSVVYTSSTTTNLGNTYVITDVNGGEYTRTAYVFTFDTSAAILPALDVTETYTILAYDSNGNAVGISETMVRASTSDSYIGAMVITGMDIASVPEPTALALLALGVAGIALRRRA